MYKRGIHQGDEKMKQKSLKEKWQTKELGEKKEMSGLRNEKKDGLG